MKSGNTMDCPPPGYPKPIYIGLMATHYRQEDNQEISPRGIESPVGSPSSSVGSSSPFRPDSPPPIAEVIDAIPDFAKMDQMLAEMNNSLWIIPRPLGSEPTPEKTEETKESKNY